MKRETFPRSPYKRKAKGKEIKTWFLVKPSKTARACVRERYREAGAAADELVRILGGNPVKDRRTWAFYCFHFDIDAILDKAYQVASCHRNGELKNPITAFQRWLQKNFKEAV